MSFVALVVEDAEFQASVYRHALTMIAEKVYVAANLKDALEIAQAQTALHIVTLDLHMPGSSADEVLESIAMIHAKHPTCAVILLTGDESEETRRKVSKFDQDAFALKGDVCTTALLLKLVLTVLAKRVEGSPEMKARLDELVSKLAKCQP